MARKASGKAAKVPAPEPTPEPVARPAPAPATPPPANIHLDPADWYLAPWRNLPPLPRPEPKPFDQKAALATLAKLNPKGEYGWRWERAGLPPTMSRPEAEFWLTAMTTAPARKSTEVAAELGTRTFDGSITEAQIRARLRAEQAPTEWVVLPLVNLITLPDLLVAMSERRGGPDWPRFPYEHMGQLLAERFATAVLPYLTAAEREELKPLVGRFISPRTWINGEIGRAHV